MLFQSQLCSPNAGNTCRKEHIKDSGVKVLPARMEQVNQISSRNAPRRTALLSESGEQVMAQNSSSLGSYDSISHMLQATPSNNSSNAPVLPAGSRLSRRANPSLTNNPANQSSMKPTWQGFIHSVPDALQVLEGCLQGKLHHIARRPHDRERPGIIVSGNVFVYEENASGIKRWTDGVTWSPSRIMGNFLVYRELNEPFPAGEKKKARKRKRGNEDSEHGQSSSHYSDEDRRLVGSLVDSYGFKADGLIKKTLNVKYQSINHHIVSYYSLADVKSGLLRRPDFDSMLIGCEPREELYECNNFKIHHEPTTEELMIDPYATMGPGAIFQPTALHMQQGPLHLLTTESSAISPGTDLTYMSTPVLSQSPQSQTDYMQQPHLQPFDTQNQYMNHHLGGIVACPVVSEDRIDSVQSTFRQPSTPQLHHHHHQQTNSNTQTQLRQRPVLKTEFDDYGSLSSYSSTTSNDGTISAPLGRATNPGYDIYGVGNADAFGYVGSSGEWQTTTMAYNTSTMQPVKRRHTTEPQHLPTTQTGYFLDPATGQYFLSGSF